MDVMILEDNFLVGEMMRLAVEDAKFDVIGPASTVEEAEMLLDRTELDGAFLDIRIRDADAFPVARTIKSRRLPFVFVSSYDRTILPPDLRDEPLIHKPATVRDISHLAADRFSSGGASCIHPTGAAGVQIKRDIHSHFKRNWRRPYRLIQRSHVEEEAIGVEEGAAVRGCSGPAPQAWKGGSPSVDFARQGRVGHSQGLAYDETLT